MGFTVCLQKYEFENSANCGIIEIHFLETKKTLFYSTLSTFLQPILLSNFVIN